MKNKRGRPKIRGGSIFQRKSSAFWWMRYRDREGKLRRESTGTADEQQANRLLRDRLDARDEGRLPAILAGQKLTFDQWADWFLERRSKPPFRSEKTHVENLNALKFLRPAFGENPLTEVTADAIEDYIASALVLRKEGTHEVRDPACGKAQAGHRAPGIPHFEADSECRGKEEMFGCEPL